MLDAMAHCHAFGRGGSIAFKNFRRADRGTVAIEFAFVLVAFLTILFGIVSFGFQFATRIALSYAIAEGGRSAVAGLTSLERKSLATTAITRVINTFSPMVDPARAIVTVSSAGQTGNGEAILVSVQYTDGRFNVFPFLPALNATADVHTTFIVSDPSS